MHHLLSFLLLTVLPSAALADGSAAGPKKGKVLFETHCGVCHSLDLPRSQHLDRNNWEWVMEDMVVKYGATWITPEQQRLIIDYLVAKHGPKS